MSTLTPSEQITQLQEENNKFRKQKKRMTLAISVLSLSTISTIVLWLCDIYAQPFYERQIPNADLPPIVNTYRNPSTVTSKTNLIVYKVKSIEAYHKRKFNDIIKNTGIRLSNLQSWEMFFYPIRLSDGKMSLAVMPGIVQKDNKGNIIDAFDYFSLEPAESSIYNGIKIPVYDFGHLEP